MWCVRNGGLTLGMDNLEVRMVHEKLADTPVFACPEPYKFEFYKAGREQDWLRIHQLSDQWNVFTPLVFADQFGKGKKLLKTCQYYLIDSGGVPIGTATAWKDARTEYSGRVHWVAILPEFQGKGLAKPLLSTVCQNLLAAGHTKGCLSTTTARVPAINLYLKFGFHPLIQSEEDALNWFQFERETGISLPKFK
jgi:GNAT superfamily N-acetyltransferase